MKTRSLIAALAAVHLMGCAAPATEKVDAAFVGVRLLGEHAFCVYDVSWEIEGLLGAPGAGRAAASKCTPDRPNAKGLFVNAGGGQYRVALLPTNLLVHYRREEQGPAKTARFNLATLPVPEGYRAVSVTPYITPRGVMLWVFVAERNAREIRDQKRQLLQLPEVADE